MTWAKLDDGFCEHRKVVTLSDQAFRVAVEALCYAARNLTDGELTTVEVKSRTSWTKRAKELVTAGLWEETESGYAIHDFLTYNPSREQVNEERARNAERQARSRNGRSHTVTDGVTHGDSNAVSSGVPSRSRPEPQKKQERELGSDQRLALVEKYAAYASSDRLNETIDLALAHVAASKTKRLDLYVNNWLRKEFIDNARPQRSRPAFNNDAESRHHGPYDKVVQRG